MNRLFARLAVTGVVLAISWGIYAVSDTTDCSGPKSDAWAEASLERMDQADLDYQAWTGDTAASEFVAYAQRAGARYQAQLDEDTISCLEGLQEHTVAFLFYEWEMYKAASAGDWDAAEAYDAQSVDAMDQLSREYDKLASKYNWDEE